MYCSDLYCSLSFQQLKLLHFTYIRIHLKYYNCIEAILFCSLSFSTVEIEKLFFLIKDFSFLKNLKKSNSNQAMAPLPIIIQTSTTSTTTTTEPPFSFSDFMDTISDLTTTIFNFIGICLFFYCYKNPIKKLLCWFCAQQQQQPVSTPVSTPVASAVQQQQTQQVANTGFGNLFSF